MSEAGDPKLFLGECRFFLAASEAEHVPPAGLPEIAFWGRSNVGKSSLLNALTGRKSLARTSNTPGRTQQIIFFSLADRLVLADLPGYGHAEAPKTTIRQWNRLIRAYLGGRATLRCVCLLFDARHGCLKADHEMMEFLDKMAVSYQVVLTKADKVKPAEAEARVAEVAAILRRHPAARPEVMLTSADTGSGILALRALLSGFSV